ncbi:MAG: hypothetical protein CFH21_01002 [Alphaproteobacteria bacterium MarineAlpha5_Bin11]|nr:MAG: hypothetical protein CFH21_01002 [Alphaproteobacteria bacterium MarineAlpha5_Bin11]
MIKILKKNENLHKLTTHKKIFEIIRLRLQINSKDKELVRRTLGVLARPQNFLLGIRTLYATVDNIWYIAGDRSTDFNYYTKRLILSKIYSSTIIYWLNDESKSIEKTEKFLLKQIKNTSIFPKIKKTLTAIFR